MHFHFFLTCEVPLKTIWAILLGCSPRTQSEAISITIRWPKCIGMLHKFRSKDQALWLNFHTKLIMRSRISDSPRISNSLFLIDTQLMSCLLDRTSVHVWLFWILHHGDTVNWDAADDQPCPTPSSSEHSGTTYSKLHDIQINKTVHCSHR
jgi:hypothetical protein